MKNRKVFLFVSIVATLCALSTINPLSAQAGEEAPEKTTIEFIEGSELLTAPETNDSQHARHDFVEDQARIGNLVDVTSVDSATVEETTVTWQDGIEVQSVEVTTTEETITIGANASSNQDTTDSAVEIGIEYQPSQKAETYQEINMANGLGLGGASNVTGGKRVSNLCVSTTKTGGTVTSCYEKYKLSDSTPTRDLYYYGRWATAEGKSVKYLRDWVPTVIDIRSRPVNDSRGANIATLADYFPRSGSKPCTEKATLQAGYGRFTLTIPMQECKDLTPIPNATTKTMGIIYDQGLYATGRSHGADFGMVVNTYKGKIPYFGDYSYAKFCNHDCQANIRKDGW